MLTESAQFRQPKVAHFRECGFVCERCRDERDAECTQKRRDAIDDTAIDQLVAQPERVRRASGFDCGISP